MELCQSRTSLTRVNTVVYLGPVEVLIINYVTHPLKSKQQQSMNYNIKLTCQSVVHIEPEKLDFLQHEASIDEHPGKRGDVRFVRTAVSPIDHRHVCHHTLYITTAGCDGVKTHLSYLFVNCGGGDFIALFQIRECGTDHESCCITQTVYVHLTVIASISSMNCQGIDNIKVNGEYRHLWILVCPSRLLPCTVEFTSDRNDWTQSSFPFSALRTTDQPCVSASSCRFPEFLGDTQLINTSPKYFISDNLWCR